MKLVAAAKLKRAQERAESARPYAEKMEGMISSLAKNAGSSAPQLLSGNGQDKRQLWVIVSSDRGLLGGFNATMLREVRRRLKMAESQGQSVQIMTIGRKATSSLNRDYGHLMVASYEELSKPVPSFDKAKMIGKEIEMRFEKGEFDKCVFFYTRFVSALTQIVTPLSLIPFEIKESKGETMGGEVEYEPSEEAILTELLPTNLGVQIYRGFLESFASEQGARMTAMDNASRNAKDVINRLSITYNRSRQAQITKELIEIISGAEAL